MAQGMALLLVLGLFNAASAHRFEVKDGNRTCIIAELAINFTVEIKPQEKVTFALPATATVNVADSTCDVVNKTTPLLIIQFGSNNSLSLHFNESSSRYEVDELRFSYNLSDKSIFPNSTVNETRVVTSKNAAISAETGTAYKCVNPHLIVMENDSVTFHNITLEAYLKKNNFSEKETHCSEDVTPTKPPITTTPTPAPTPVPTGNPATGNYVVNGSSGACLMAKMGLQLNITYIKKNGKKNLYLFNIDPTNVNVTGNCSSTSANLTLSAGKTIVSLRFAQNSSKYHLSGATLNTTLPADANVTVFEGGNDNLTYFETNAPKSYKCNAKLVLNITDSFDLNTFNLQIQPFNVSDNKFGAAVECVQDENGMLVPIVVGAALAGLVLIVLIAYLIGRKRSHAGYQTI